jgi:predicted RNA-binding Zn-ribbon protein involved in translation (DUF1610 family)
MDRSPPYAIISLMSDSPTDPPTRPITHVASASCSKPATTDGKMICERCGTAEMYRMHAVWRCPSCGFKTDCCGW